ncbi:putative multidrug transporter [Rosellinia necatrix]|uniref:Putative multidrug transporter n=1 Tax=Rosellinia necatrix TaxID=77044 RepID=A0A1W2TDZ3_ROSNE|nr:putative multidrug transporter [Rosellinia necatrix]
MAAVESIPCPDADKAEPHSIFDKRQKALIVFIAATAATFSGFASNIYFPALATVARDLDVSVELVNLTVTSYLIFQGIAPSLWGPLSDARGRRVAYCCTFLVFLGACVGLAETRNYAVLLVLRSLQSSGSASTIAVGAAVIGDITTQEERGGYMGIFQAGLLAPVAVGPVIGGALAASLGWRAIFWFLTIYSGVFLVFLIIILPETLRSVVGNGGARPSNPIARYPLNFYQKTTKVKFTAQAQSVHAPKKTKIDIAGPIRILFSKQAAPLVAFLGIYYAVWQMSITAMAVLFEERYGLSETQIGLTFIANGAGSIVGTLVTGKILDIDYRRVKAKHESALAQGGPGIGVERISQMQYDNASFPLEKARLRLLPILALFQCASILAFGWTIQSRVHYAVPIVTTFITGWTVVSITSVITTYLIDIFPGSKAASSASVNLARCLLAAGGTSIVTPIINAVGIGWTFTITVAVQIIALVGVAIQWRFGGKWRMEANEAKKQNATGVNVTADRLGNE